MWKYIFLGAAKMARWGWKTGSKGIGLLGKAFGTTGKYGAIGRTLWKTVDYGMTAYLIYDLFIADDSTPEQLMAAQSFVMGQLVPPEVAVTLESEIRDTKAVAFAFRVAGLKLMGSSVDGRTITGLSYLALGSYIEEVPVGTRYDAEHIKTIISNEMGSFILGGQNSLTEEEQSEIANVFADLDFDSLDIIGLRKMDFICYILDNLVDPVSAMVANTQGNQNGLGSPSLQPVVNGDSL